MGGGGVFFYVDSLFSPRRGHFLRVVGLFFRILWGVFLVLPPTDFFTRAPIIVATLFYCTDIYIFSRSWRFQFFEGTFFFSRGGG